MGVGTSAKTLNTQTSVRVAECKEISFHAANRTHKKWSHLPTSEYTVTPAEGKLIDMMS